MAEQVSKEEATKSLLETTVNMLQQIAGELETSALPKEFWINLGMVYYVYRSMYGDLPNQPQRPEQKQPQSK
jgi:hypothetical protein